MINSPDTTFDNSSRIRRAKANRLPRLEEVVDHAVDCRDHYFHGNPTKLDYDRFHTRAFLTD